MTDNNNMVTRSLLTKHFVTYPKLEIEDMFKYIFQSAFGCEHMVKDFDTALGYIKQESEQLTGNETALTERLDGSYSRVHLSHLNEGLGCETLAKLFLLSAKKEENGKKLLEEKISVLKELVDEKKLLFDSAELDKALSGWEGEGYPALHHSETFRRQYRPSYRVISNRYADFLPVFTQIDTLCSDKPIVVAVEGSSASGKSTLSEILKQVYGCAVFHTDDFFLRPQQRTKERLSEVGGNFDRERFFDEVIKPLSEQKDVCFRRFDCSSMSLCEPERVKHNRITVIEGAYCMHPDLSDYYDFSVFLDIDEVSQRERILRRNSALLAERFFNEWIPLERMYFSGMNIKEKCSLCLEVRDTYTVTDRNELH